MSRYTGPKLRKVRRFGEEFAIVSDRTIAKKFIKSHHKQPPGMHGAKMSFRKHTGYGLQLLEKQKARVFYHIGEKHMRRYYDMASKQKGSASENILRILESRLDNVIYRAGFADSHPQARQWVSHRQFAVNGQRVDIPSILVKAGDKVEIVGKSSKLKEIMISIAKENKPVSWLKVDPQKLTIEVQNLPVREEIDLPVEEQSIIEFYSK